ncbi:hypothetical protein [Pontiella sulfatireligans]|uniref:N-sulphoglucosamine sulphohydrolase C-terminal domain-containing protein n=1 Tax=Pontiella sulfatireligans TaxID=2750658 RepID=A0A6C2UEK2_9BACT|nr:hypothetical protein [Pontiella sulfatireligans]VGO18642.1 hypothetical protein SCARR_00695 [Pontiella sulfatireligans]
MQAEPAFIELYDYVKDPLETRSLAGNPEQTERMAAYEKALKQKIAEIAACKVR